MARARFRSTIVLGASLLISSGLVGCAQRLHDRPNSIYATCYVKNYKSLQVLYSSNNAASLSIEESAKDWAHDKFHDVHVDIAKGLGPLITEASPCNILYVDNTQSELHCNNKRMDALLADYGRTYRTSAALVDTAYPVLFVDWQVEPVGGIHLAGTTIFPGNPLASVSYIFEQQIDAELSPHINANNIGFSHFYYVDFTSWTVAHELGHQIANLTDVNFSPPSHTLGFDCMMMTETWDKVIPTFVGPAFCRDSDISLTNSCRDNLATVFHLRDCPP